jgi:hypothetical protein
MLISAASLGNIAWQVQQWVTVVANVMLGGEPISHDTASVTLTLTDISYKSL